MGEGERVIEKNGRGKRMGDREIYRERENMKKRENVP